jgi:lysophospholipase L1-like esterase
MSCLDFITPLSVAKAKLSVKVSAIENEVLVNKGLPPREFAKAGDTRNTMNKYLGTKTLFFSLAAITAAVTARPLSAQSVALAGDSTVATYDSKSKKQGWGKNLNLYTVKLSVKNFAKGGRTTKSFRSEGHWKTLMNSKPTFAFVQFGHNDASSSKDRHVPLNSYKSYLEQYAADARGKNIKPFFVTPPRRCRFKSGKVTSELSSYVKAMKDTAAKLNVPVIDLDARSAAFLQKEGSKICKKLFDDETHTNNEGSKAYAQLVAQEAKKFSELAPYFK